MTLAVRAVMKSYGTRRYTNPLDLPGLLRWYDASDTATITGASLTTGWADKSGNGGHLYTDGTAPGFLNNLVTVNGRNALAGTGTHCMIATALSDALTRLKTQQMYAFVVMGNSKPTGYSLALTTEPNFTGVPSQNWLCGEDSDIVSVVNSINNDTRYFAAGAGTGDGSIHVIGYTEQYDLVSTIHFDATTTTDITTSDIIPESLFHYGYVGTTWILSGLALYGTICEAFWGNGPLTPAQIANVKASLRTKWGTP